MQAITSKDNAKLKAVRALVRSKKERQATSCFVMEGVRALSALVDGSALSQYQLKEVWVSEDAVALAEKFDVPVFSIPPGFMEQLSDCRTSQGILGVVEYTVTPLEINPEQGNYLLLDRLMDPGNMGTLIRSAVAFGFDGVLLHGDCVEVFNPKTVRATMGALPFSKVWATALHHSASRSGEKDGESDIFQRVEELGYDLISTAMGGGENLHRAAFGSKTVLVIGNEANGVSDSVFKRCTRTLTIPMTGPEPTGERGSANAGQRPTGVANVESLNAGVAGSICMCAISSAKI